MSSTVSNGQQSLSIERPCLYVVATPIGNLADLSHRGLDILRGVDRIVAEDTRTSSSLLRHYQITTRLSPLHEHNERQLSEQLVADALRQKQAIAIISDAGTPLISDPGLVLVRTAHESGLPVRPVPGPSALLAALSVSGIATDQFLFVGFLSAKSGPRKRALGELATTPSTLVLFEAPHRIEKTLADLLATFGPQRATFIGREMTKRFETHYRGTLAEVTQQIAMDNNASRGELVIVLAGADKSDSMPVAEAERLLRRLLEHLPARTAVDITAECTGLGKNAVYRMVHGEPET